MMPLGSQNSGGRSSSLSPLAPPFTLDKPYHKQHNSKPPMNFSEPYGHRFDRPRPVWSPPVNSSFGPNFTENSSKDISFPPQDVHGFLGSQPNNSSSSSTRLAPLKSASGNAGHDGSSYEQYSNSIPTTLAEAKPYYPPYVVADDREMVARKEPNYDLLSNFGVAQLSGASQAEDTRNVSGVKYTPQWNGIWNGLNDVEQGNWLDLGGNYALKDHKHSELSTGQQGTRKGSDAGGDHYDFHVGTLPAGSLGSYVETSIKSTNCFDGFGGENSFGSPSIEDRKSFKEPNPAVTSTRLSSLGSEMTQDPFLQRPLPSYGFCEGPVDSQDKHTNYFDSYVLDSTSTMRSFPANTNKVTFGGFPSPQYAAPSATVESVRNEAMDKTEKSPDFLPYHPFGINFHVSNYTGNSDSLFTGSSSNILEANIKKKQVNDDSFDHPLSTVPHLSMAECLKIKGDNAEAFYSMDKYSDGPDIQNPAEDSPCWKGARFQPFEDSKMVIPDIVLEMSESCFKQNGEEEQMNNPTRLYTTDGTDTTRVLGEAKDNLASKRSSNPVSRDHDGTCSMMQGLHSAKLFGEDGFQSFDKKHALDLGVGNNLSLLNYSGIVSSPSKSQPLQKYSEVCEISPEETVLELKCKNSSDGLSCSPTNAGDEMLHSPSGNVAASLTSQQSGKDLSSKVDINVLVNTMMNLSEVLVSHCSNSHDTSTELDHAALKHIISNLNSCLVKKADQATQTEKSQDPQQDTYCVEGSLQALMASKATPVRMEQHDHDFFGSWKNDLCSRNEDHSGSSSVKGNAETVRDAETIQALKSVLEMNFPSEELQPETVLYKNLWLEAEAALCATTIKSRFNRMKKEAEKEKRDYRRTNEEEHVPISKASDVKKAAGSSYHEVNDSPSSDMESSVIARFRTLRSVVEDPKATNPIAGQKRPSFDCEARQTPAFSSPQSQAGDFEASVMARFQTLKSRADNSDPVSTDDEKSPPIKDNFGPPSPDQSMSDSYFSNMANHIADPDAAFMSRFNFLKARTGQSDSLDCSHMENLTGSFSMSSNSAGNKARKVIGLGDELLEGWYDCSEPGWEHVSKEGGTPKQK